MRVSFALLLAVPIIFLTQPAAADDAAPLVVTLDKVQMVHLAAPASSVVLGNQTTVDVTMETPTLMLIFGKMPGETSLIVLGMDQKPVLARPVLVTTQDERLVSVYVPGTDGPTSRAYSCLPNRCLRIASPDGTPASGAAPSGSAAGTPTAPAGAAAPGAASMAGALAGGAPQGAPPPSGH